MTSSCRRLLLHCILGCILVLLCTSGVALAVTPQIASGFNHTVALKNDGTVWTWGSNRFGQLGNGNKESHAAPAIVPTISGVIEIAAGDYHGVALKSDGTVWTWGYNNLGQLGNGTKTDQWLPVQVPGLSGVTRIAAGVSHTVALKSDGSLWAWGSNSSGQLGDGTYTSSTFPVRVSPLTGVVSIAAGGFSTLAVTSDGSVWGTGSYFGRVPVQKTGLSQVTEVAGGRAHFMALKNDGTVLIWGDNSYGQLGIGTSGGFQDQPVQVAGLAGIRSIRASYNHSIALKSDGTVWSWGDNWSGQLGNGSIQNQLSPVQIGLSGVTGIGTGFAQSLAIKNDGTVWSWGGNGGGQLGTGVTAKLVTPTPLSGMTAVEHVAAGYYQSQVVKSDGSVWGWGNNQVRELGDGTIVHRWTPVQAWEVGSAEGVAAGGYNALFLKSDGSVWGAGSIAGSRVRYMFDNAADIAVGENSALALRMDGTVWIATFGTYSFAQVPGLADVVAIASGGMHRLVLKSDGTVWAWGDNQYGQIGNGNNAPQNLPVQVAGLSEVDAIWAGRYMSFARTADGTIWSWGRNMYGELGDGSKSDQWLPVPVVGLTDVASISGGNYHTVAVKTDGTVWGWGDNRFAQLGDGTTTSRPLPAPVSGLTGIKEVATGLFHCVAAKNDGSVLVWGRSSYGELGVGAPPGVPTKSLINLDAAVPLFVVDVSAGAGGSILPNTPQLVSSGSVAKYELSPGIGYRVASVDGCGGSLLGSTYTTAQIDAPCEVSALFTKVAGNVAPSIAGGPATGVVAGDFYSFFPFSGDENGDSLVFSVINKPTWADFDPSTGTLSGTPRAADVGTFGNIVITVSDGALGAQLPPFSITVTLPLPTISGTPMTSVAANTVYTFAPTATNASSFSIVNKPPWATFNPATGALTGTLTNADAGLYGNIVISAINATGTASLPSFSIAITTSSTGVSEVSAGSNIPTAPLTSVSVTFNNVSNGGKVVAIPNPEPAQPPPNFRVVTGASYLISTDANFSGNVDVCLGYSDAALADPTHEQSIKLFHYNGVTWDDVTVSVDTVANIVCGRVASFSPFVISEPTAPQPSISGVPAATATVGSLYRFTPAAVNAASFSISNKPSWASFDTATGTLSGTPRASDVGTTSCIVVSALNQSGATSLPAFSITVPVPVPGSCGTSNGAVFLLPPVADLCAAGGATSLTGTGPWSWSCTGDLGGANASCSATKVANTTTPVATAGQPSVNFAGGKAGGIFTVFRSEGGRPGVQVYSGPSASFTDPATLNPNTIYQYTVTSDTDATPTTILTVRTPLCGGWNIVAVPFDTTGVNPASFFASPVSAIYQWTPTGPTPESSDSVLGSYATVSALQPGNGYFVKTSNGSTLLAYDGRPGPASADITLKPGWTMIANPSTGNKTAIGTNWSIDGKALATAIGESRIGGGIYWWNGTTYESWSIVNDNPQIEPWKGYWIVNLDNVAHTLTIR